MVCALGSESTKTMTPSGALEGCPGCGSSNVQIFLDMQHVPRRWNSLSLTREAALSSPMGRLQLAHCRACALMYNVAFEGAEGSYDASYDNTLQHSQRFRRHAARLCQYLIDRYSLREKDIVEIGCGDAGVLGLLCQMGPNRGVGFDPAYDAAKVRAVKGMNIVPSQYTLDEAQRPVDFILCRQVLEHIDQPLKFLKGLRRIIGERRNTTVFFGVPNGLKMLRDLMVWDVIYEHVSYFTAASIERLFLRAGFNPLRISERYEGQFLDVEAVPSDSPRFEVPPDLDESLPEVQRLTESFDQRFRSMLEYWGARLNAIRAASRNAVIWGAGAKGVMFLNNLRVTPDAIRFAVDINPNKQGKYLAGTGQQIIPPSFLREYRPEIVILMNDVYQNEVRQQLNSMGLSPEIWVVSGGVQSSNIGWEAVA
jgi:SAM-dependent methyltransferase